MNMHEPIEIEDGLRLVYQEPKEYTRYYSIYHGQKYADSYFRRSPETLVEVVTIFDCGYFIMEGDTIIGGVLLKPNFISDLFVVPPYKDYEGLASNLLNYVKKISSTEEKIIVREVVEEHVATYEQLGCKIQEVNIWMIRPTGPMMAILPEGYSSRAVASEDADDIACLLMKAYRANPAYKQIGTKEDYLLHVNEFIDQHKHNKIMDESSRVVFDTHTNTIVGVCLHMEFEDYPLIMSLVVDPGHQQRGIGRYLLTHSIHSSSDGYPATRLSVIEDNAAIKLYEDLGFLRSKTIIDMYLA
ncbi:GNAT family N-acetyltransferase [Rossellomorea vietnamensis]|uniref:GNAT family N-acetyltransferase n=1 Tax=Rossellomorea vietnamensis TaxID=218284 RepID=UPI001E4F05E9|nr:GNAT family N-acetyltransferase [Rossellomorea vietnamensis]MCC5801188.1 GNAT family N-acetyltransferase [Rossellomorea vietnamensis]